jgi:hypothetical protein
VGRLGGYIKVDIPLMRQTGQHLGEISATLKRAKADSGGVVAAMAQPDLARAMKDFESNWRIHRDQLIEQIDGHQQVVVGAANSYHELDSGQAHALDGPASCGPPAGGAK